MHDTDTTPTVIAPSLAPSLATAHFTGRRPAFFGLLLAGYLLLIPTLGLARFWLTTAKRRFYWTNTVIGGDALEYTGNARQLLTGFLFALAFFLPLYVGLFFVALQSTLLVRIGYGVFAVVIWFLTGYAIYRGRDYRLSHTLWRGIRFGQDGNAWAYALRRFLWSLLVLATAGLAYPFMMASLWRYRYAHTLYGDRRFSFEGSWKTIAGPFYFAWVPVAVALGFWIVMVRHALGDGFTSFATFGSDNTLLLLAPFAIAVLGWLAFIYFRSREATRMFSAVRLGEARISVRVKARSILGQYLLMALALLGAGVALWLFGSVLFNVVQAIVGDASFSSVRIGPSVSVAMLVGLALGYLVSFGTFSLMGELFADMGYWMLVARGATITGFETLDDVGSGGVDGSVVGEGLADALNVGAF